MRCRGAAGGANLVGCHMRMCSPEMGSWQADCDVLQRPCLAFSLLYLHLLALYFRLFAPTTTVLDASSTAAHRADPSNDVEQPLHGVHSDHQRRPRA